MAKNSRKTLDYLIDLFTPEIRDVFLAVINDITDNAIIGEIIKAIQDGDPEAAFRAIGFSDAALNPLVDMIETAFERGGVLAGASFPKHMRTPSGGAVFRFNVRNSRSEAYLRDHSSQLVSRLTDEARTNVRSTLQRGMIDGRNPRSVALDMIGRIDPSTHHRVGGIIGLTPRQEIWAANANRDLRAINDLARQVRAGTLTVDDAMGKSSVSGYLGRALRDKRGDRAVLAAIRDGKPLTAETVEKLSTSYRNNALKYRGETIARTEAMQALNASEHEAHLQAVDTGALRRQDVKRFWDSAGDKRVRHSHALMDGQSVGVDEPFKSPSGALLMYPGDTSLGAGGEEVIQCRCRVRLEVDFLAQWND